MIWKRNRLGLQNSANILCHQGITRLYGHQNYSNKACRVRGIDVKGERLNVRKTKKISRFCGFEVFNLSARNMILSACGNKSIALDSVRERTRLISGFRYSTG